MTQAVQPQSPPSAAGPKQSVLPRLAALMGGGGSAEPVSFTVDGAAVRAEPHGRALRLTCEVLPALPDDEAAVRALMARYLPYADHGAEVMCTDEAGRLLLLATVEPGDDLPAAVREFCDAAVHWSQSHAAGAARPNPGTIDLPARMPAAMIFP